MFTTSLSLVLSQSSLIEVDKLLVVFVFFVFQLFHLNELGPIYTLQLIFKYYSFEKQCRDRFDYRCVN